ncbi:MAG: hypothetical protein JXJ18_07465 [Rhodobacteraceae bacterium]|nr:hypothetical protein [Paracoccaceae bacterium]
MPNSLAPVFTAILLAGALIAGATQQPAWTVLILAGFAIVANALSPSACAARAAQGKTLAKALPTMVVNQLIWVNLVFLVGFGAAWLFGGPIIAAPIWLPIAVSALGLAGALVTSAKG